jgi:hypothetical protein
MLTFSKFYQIYLHVLEEGVKARTERYMQMFGKVLEQDDTLSKNLNDIVQRSIGVLKKDNIVVWFLKSVRTSILKELTRADSFPTQQINLARQTLNSLEHYLSLPINKIQRYDYRDGVTEALLKFRDWESEWKTDREQWIDITDELVDGSISELIKFDDGFVWFDLDRRSCKIEGGAMGHCGNTASARDTDTVLSLRKVVKQGGRVFARPSLTFILNDNSTLGEMKGRANEKPNPKYHPHILKLLTYKVNTSSRGDGEDYLIKRIVGGGYAADNNFDISDLSEEQSEMLFRLRPELFKFRELSEERQQKIRELRPDLLPFTEKVKLGLMGEDDIKREIANLFISGSGGGHAQYSTPEEIMAKIQLKDNFIYYRVWENWNELVDTYQPPNLYSYGDYISGDKNLTEDMDYRAPEEDLIDLLERVMGNNVVNFRIMEAVKEWITEYPDLLEELDIDPSDITIKDVYTLLKVNDPDTIDTLRDAIRAGYESGTYSQLVKYFKSGIESLIFIPQETDVLSDTIDHSFSVVFENSDHWYDSPLLAKFSIDSIGLSIEHDSDPFDPDPEIEGDMDVPYYGFDDYDSEAAIDYFTQELRI